MALDQDFLDSLICPESREPLSLADEGLLLKVNAAVVGGLKNKGGEAVPKALDGGLLRADGKVLYPIWNDIPNLLVDEGIAVDALG